ncbi:hypothetical protein C1H46_039453 [Malus baccata]|uniref:Uncharacterized protein n=1 Tax=Malus baccata TaxID=106549 RepID=A0A540KLC0_MALBA|nr:hypothetical protein C1H46_039453 [Malus baccata]
MFIVICHESMEGCVELWLGCSHHHFCEPLLVLPDVRPCWRCFSWDLSSCVLPWFLVQFVAADVLVTLRG